MIKATVKMTLSNRIKLFFIKLGWKKTWGQFEVMSISYKDKEMWLELEWRGK